MSLPTTCLGICVTPLEAEEGGVPILLGEGRESKDAPVSLRKSLIQDETRGLDPGLDAHLLVGWV